MTETKKPSEIIHLGGKKISEILKELGNFGWELNRPVLSLAFSNPMYLDVERAMYSGDFKKGCFFHFVNEQTYADHSDTLEFRGKKLVRTCPKFNKKQTVASRK
ncbi:MAG: hypothetical protein AAB437_00825 [Patescibacteria group bacterium]